MSGPTEFARLAAETPSPVTVLLRDGAATEAGVTAAARLVCELTGHDAAAAVSQDGAEAIVWASHAHAYPQPEDDAGQETRS